MSTTPHTPRAVPAPTPLSPDQIAEIELGRRHARRIRRAAMVASMSGWTLAVFALFSLPMGLFGDWPSLGIGAALAGVAFNELKGADRLRQFDVRAPKRLARGQLFLGIAIAGYAAWNWYAQIHNRSQSSFGDSDVDAMFNNYVETITPIVWGSIAIVGLLTCWLTAAYYASKSKTVRIFRERTPPWVIEVLAKAG